METCLLDIDDLLILDISSGNALNLLWYNPELISFQALHLACFLIGPQEGTGYILLPALIWRKTLLFF